MFRWLRSVAFTGNRCGAAQRIPLRRIHFFERFHQLTEGPAVLIRCPACGQGLQIAASYRSHTGESVTFDPENHP